MQTLIQKEATFAMPENKSFALIAAVIPHGESDLVVDATSRRRRLGHHDPCAGAGRRRGQPVFHITIQPEKEVVFTIVPLSIKRPSCSPSATVSWKKAANTALCSPSGG